MKKLDLHRDPKEPSLEEIKSHMNFEQVLKGSGVKKTTTSSGMSKYWWLGGAGAVIIVSAIWLFQNTPGPSANYTSSAPPAPVAIEKMTLTDPVEEIVLPTVSMETESATAKMANKEEQEEPKTSKSIDKIAYLEPKLVSSIPFVFEEDFQLRAQYQQFQELSIYDHLSFQPIDKAQQSMLKLTWDSVHFDKDKNGQYFLILFKMEQGVICPVNPVFEKDNYIDALNAYQAHQ